MVSNARWRSIKSNDLDGFVTITNSLNDSAINYAVKGYDQDGNFQMKTSGGNSSQVTGQRF